MTERVHKICIATGLAQALGTYNALDRSKQYPLDDDQKLRDAVNQSWTKIHHLERQGDEKDLAIANLEKKLGNSRYLNHALISIIVILAWEGVKALAVHYLR